MSTFKPRMVDQSEINNHKVLHKLYGNKLKFYKISGANNLKYMTRTFEM